MSRLAPADKFEKAMYELGRMDERAALITRLKAQICFDFFEGDCSHGACYGFNSLIRELLTKSNGETQS